MVEHLHQHFDGQLVLDPHDVGLGLPTRMAPKGACEPRGFAPLLPKPGQGDDGESRLVPDRHEERAVHLAQLFSACMCQGTGTQSQGLIWSCPRPPISSLASNEQGGSDRGLTPGSESKPRAETFAAGYFASPLLPLARCSSLFELNLR